MKCWNCNGDGYYSEHANTPAIHEEIGCRDCPIQVECDVCKATGVTDKPQPTVTEPSNDMPF